MYRQQIEEQLAAFPVYEYAFIHTSDLEFTERVRYICENECPQYGKSWSCPPAVGTVAECKEKCMHFQKGIIFTTVTEVEDITDLEETLATRIEHEKITRQVRDLFQKEYKEVLTLSTESCAICEVCAYPEAPCRHPDRMFPCVESFGILVTALAERYGMTFLNGSNVATWFSLILYR